MRDPLWPDEVHEGHKLPSGSRLARYAPFIDDWERFCAAASRPMVPALRANTLRCPPERLWRALEDQGFALEPVAWANGLFCCRQTGLARTMEHWAGWFYLQELTQTLPVHALDPQPGESIVDLCASPGGKTCHIAARTGDHGLLVANEPAGRRHPPLLANLNRLGILSALVTAYRGESFPLRERFDRVLVDAPCSGEGTLRKEPAVRMGASPSTVRRLAALQRRLIVRGYDLLRPGGVLVYSTCTLAPEENEAAVAHLLRERDAVVEPVAWPVDGAPGLLEWGGESFPEGVARCRRFYPHHFDSGGGFVARVRRPGG